MPGFLMPVRLKGSEILNLTMNSTKLLIPLNDLITIRAAGDSTLGAMYVSSACQRKKGLRASSS